MLTETQGVVFRKIPYSETSIISDIYTYDHGLMSYIISGVRKPKARTSASLLEVMSIVEIVAYHSDKNKLHRIKEIKPAYIYGSIPVDVRKNAILLFMAELCSKTIREPEQNESLFEMIKSHLIQLDQTAKGYNNLHLEFMVKLADELGFGPSNNFSEASSGFDLMGGEFVGGPPKTHLHYVPDAENLAVLISKARGNNHEMNFDRSARNILIDLMVDYFRIHIENLREIKSHLILREVL